MHRLLRPLIVAAALVVAGPAIAVAQPAIDPNTGQPVGGSAEPSNESTPAPPNDTLVCSGDWRFSLIDDREEIGPARFARQADLEKDLALSGAATGYCATAAAQDWPGKDAGSQGPCYGLALAGNKMSVAAATLFSGKDADVGKCLTDGAQAGGQCEAVRNELTTLRTYDEIAVDRAELVLAYQVCASPESDTNAALRAACTQLQSTVSGDATPEAKFPGLFSLTTPLPSDIAARVAAVKNLTDGRFLSATPEAGAAIRRSMCGLSTKQADISSGLLDQKWFMEGVDKQDARAKLFFSTDGTVRWSMCNELDMAIAAAQSCRAADIYIDERGEIHLNSPLTTRDQRARATMCIDISDFDPDQPLMVTLGLDSTGSVPDRVWPGETMKIGSLIDRKVSREDVLSLHVYGRAHGASLAEVLKINGVDNPTAADKHDEACRMARSWVPVVDHEVPIGDPSHQAVIPIEYARGRVGETKRIDEGDYVVLWVKDIQPNGSVTVEYASGQAVGYQPPPLLGESGGAGEPPNAYGTQSGYGQPPPPSTLAEPGENTSLGMRSASVEKPDLKRRARYPGSRVLRLGTPGGNRDFPLKVCTKDIEPASATPTASTASAPYGSGYPSGGYGYPSTTTTSSANPCASGNYIVDERLFVHGDYRMGVRIYFGYTSFPIADYGTRPIGGGEYEVVRTGAHTASYDVAVLLAAYPFGRDPRRFSYLPWKAAYWKGVALLAGFGLRDITRPWADFYGGASLPVANGVSASLLAHVSLRDIPLGVQAGDTFTPAPGSSTSVQANFAQGSAFVIGYSLGLSFDFDLFERAFTNTWDKITGKQYFNAAGTSGEAGYLGANR